MNIYIANKKTKTDTLKKKYPNAIILDVTSTSPVLSTRYLSPFYPHGNIPIPYSGELKASCVEAVWQGLKVFETEDVNYDTFKNTSMQNIKRTVRKLGKPLGHRKGVIGELLDYKQARLLIYLPTYKWMLDNIPEVQHTLSRIKEKLDQNDFVFLDYNTNTNVLDLTKPLSHAGLVKLYIEDKYPSLKDADSLKQQISSINIEDIWGEIKTTLSSASLKGKSDIIDNLVSNWNGEDPNRFLFQLNKNGISSNTNVYKAFHNKINTQLSLSLF